MPFKLVAMHIHGGGRLDRNFNFGVSVKHIEFVRAYLVSVLPYLKKSIKSVRDVHPEALTTLQDYFTTVDASIQRLQMQHLIADVETAVITLQTFLWSAHCITLPYHRLGAVHENAHQVTVTSCSSSLCLDEQSMSNIQGMQALPPVRQQVTVRSSAQPV